VAVRDDLKNIIRTHLGGAASSLFLDKALSIIDESADNKESFISAAERISKRTALFIDTDLAARLWEELKARIEESASPQGRRRRYRRFPLYRRVHVICNGRSRELYSEDISLGGIYIKTKESFPEGSEVALTLPLEEGTQVHLNGVIVYTVNMSQESAKNPAGMAIEFSTRNNVGIEKLRSYLEKMSDQGVFED
jgi:Tfp pilus assembly protein PilZ